MNPGATRALGCPPVLLKKNRHVRLVGLYKPRPPPVPHRRGNAMSATRGRLRGTAPVRTGHVQQRVHAAAAAAAVSAPSVPGWQPTTVDLPMQIVQPPDGQADQERARMARGRPAGRPVTTSRLAPRADTPLPFVRAPAGTVDLDAGIVDCIGALRDLPRRALPTELHDVRTADLRRAAVVAGLRV